MGRRPTIHDVAAAAGVSVSTVSKAVNGRYGIAVDTVERVLEVVEKLGYESSLVASSMRSRRTGVIGVLVADFEPFSAEILKGVGTALHDSRYDLLAYSGLARQPRARAGSAARSAAERHPHRRRHHGHSDRGERRPPRCRSSPSTRTPATPTCRPSSPTASRGARQATSYLIELGHRRIGFVAGPTRPALVDPARRRLPAGARRGRDPVRRLARRRRPLPAGHRARGGDRACCPAPTGPPRCSPRTTSRRSRSSRPRRSSDSTCPDDLSVVGFDDIPEASTHNSPADHRGAAHAAARRSRCGPAGRPHEGRVAVADAHPAADPAGRARDDGASAMMGLGLRFAGSAYMFILATNHQ